MYYYHIRNINNLLLCNNYIYHDDMYKYIRIAIIYHVYIVLYCYIVITCIYINIIDYILFYGLSIFIYGYIHDIYIYVSM